MALSKINGRRGAFQVLCAVMFAAHSVVYLMGRTLPMSLAWLDGVPYPLLGLVWLVPAIIGILGAFQPRPRDWFSFTALVIAPTIWGGMYVIGAVSDGRAVGVLGATLYWLLAGLIVLASGMSGDSDRDIRKVEITSNG